MTRPDLTAARNALANCGEESRMVHRDHLRTALAVVDALTAERDRLRADIRMIAGIVDDPADYEVAVLAVGMVTARTLAAKENP